MANRRGECQLELKVQVTGARQRGLQCMKCETTFITADATSRFDCEFFCPVSADDLEDIRWLIEDRPRLHSPVGKSLQDRIQARLSYLQNALGRSIFDTFDGQVVAAMVLEKPEAVSVRIVEEQGLMPIPWELLILPGGDVPLSVAAQSFNRVPPMLPSDFTTEEKWDLCEQRGGARRGTLRVLLVVARPGGEDDVSFRSVSTRIIGAVRKSDRQQIEIDILRPPHWPAMQAKLAEARESGDPYQIVHFDGHGVYQASPFHPERKQGFLCFETPEGSTQYVGGTSLAKLLIATGVSTLILNACRSGYSALSDPSDPTSFQSLAGEILAAGVNGVLAMGYNTYVVTAAQIIADAYSALAAGRTLGEAAALSRNRLRASKDTLDWLTVVSFERKSLHWLNRLDEVSFLVIGSSAATPAPPFMVDPDADADPYAHARSSARPFVGYEGTLLRLERAIQGGVVQITGLAGSGKSAVAAELARWIATTQAVRTGELAISDLALKCQVSTPQAVEGLGRETGVIVIDVERCTSFEHFLSTALIRVMTLFGATDVTPDEGTKDLLIALGIKTSLVWIFENVGHLSGQSDLQAAELKSLIALLTSGESKVIMTDRTDLGFENVPVVCLLGLDKDASHDFLEVYSLQRSEDPDAVAAWLDWAQGIPAVLLAISERNEFREDLATVRTAIYNLHRDIGDLGSQLADTCSIGYLYGGEYPDDRSILTLYLFHGFLGSDDWRLLLQMLAAKAGADPTGEAFGWHTMDYGLATLMRRGIVARINAEWLMLHPLGPYVVAGQFFGMCKHLAGDSSDDLRRREIQGLIYACFVMAVSHPDVLRSKQHPTLTGLPGEMKHRVRAQNLLFAGSVAQTYGWWEHCARMIRLLKSELIATERRKEWQEILDDVWDKYQADIPRSLEFTLEDPLRSILKLLAEECEFDENFEMAATMWEALFSLLSRERDSEATAPGKPSVPFSIRSKKTIDALLRLSSALKTNGRPGALDHLEHALAIATAIKDEPRVGDVSLEIAKCFNEIPSVRNLRQYEKWSRIAADIGKKVRILDPHLEPRANVSLGNSIVRQIVEGVEPMSERRWKEARVALQLSRQASARDIRGCAENGLGTMCAEEGNYIDAFSLFLEGAQNLMSAKHWVVAAGSYLNAARLLYKIGRLPDSLTVARAGLDAAERLRASGASLRQTLEEFIEANPVGQVSDLTLMPLTKE